MKCHDAKESKEWKLAQWVVLGKVKMCFCHPNHESSWLFTDDATCIPRHKRLERNIFMKKIIAAILVLTMVFSVVSAAIAGDVNFNNVPIHYPQILDAWNASNSDELYHHILEYWQASATEYPQAFTAKHQPLSIKIGGNTKELIAEKSKWDLAIVSSKDVN
ncbi:MAG: hypothetical protein RSA55_08445, partial [Clostridia bacterium]